MKSFLFKSWLCHSVCNKPELSNKVRAQISSGWPENYINKVEGVVRGHSQHKPHCHQKLGSVGDKDLFQNPITLQSMGAAGWFSI